MTLVLIYDKLVRPDTTGVHCEAALRSLGVAFTHYEPLVLDANKRLGFRAWRDLPKADLYLQIDDDMAYPAPGVGALKAYWCIDVHRMDHLVGGPLTRWEKLKGFDRVFSAQRDMANTLKVPWLPLAYDPNLLHPIAGMPKVWDWCFVGSLNSRRRVAAVAALKAVFPNAFVGQAYGAEMNRIYNQSRLIANISYSNDVNMRFFEAQGTGTPLLSSRPGNGEDELFEGVVYFETIDDLIERAAALFQDPAELVAAGGRQLRRVSGHHTYVQRMRSLLETCGVPIPPGA